MFDYVVLLVILCNESQHALGVGVECEAASVVAKFEAMALNQKMVEYTLSWLGVNVCLKWRNSNIWEFC